MRRRRAPILVALVAVSAISCGVEPQSAPEPLPATTPVVLPPSVTQEPAPIPPTTTPVPTSPLPPTP